MNRRKFLAALGVLPFAPRALRDIRFEEEWERFDREARPRPQPPAGVLGVAQGVPTALTVTVPPDRLLQISASVFLADGGMVKIVEAPKTTLAAAQQMRPGIVNTNVTVRPTMGTHTYKVVVEGEVVDTPVHRPYLVVKDLGV